MHAVPHTTARRERAIAHPPLAPAMMELLEPRLMFSVDVLDFEADTSSYLNDALGDATPTGTSYMLYEQHGGMWSDAEKTPSNTEDDLMCWAAAASNVLA